MSIQYMKPLPPFGKQLKTKMQSGWQPRNGVYIYPSWNMGRPYPHCITFPPEASPDDYDWSFLTGQEISLTNTNSDELYGLAIKHHFQDILDDIPVMNASELMGVLSFLRSIDNECNSEAVSPSIPVTS